MNFVFWFLIILALAAFWWGLSSFFKGIGNSAYRELDRLKDDMSNDDEEESEEVK